MSRRLRIEGLLEKEPHDVFLNFSLAMELVKEGQINAALAQFDRTVELDPSYIASYFQKANTLIGATRAPEARDVLQRGILAAQNAGDSHAVGEMQEVLDGIS